MIRHFTWHEFDESVNQIADKCKNWKISNIYGIPRGGLCLAVALSHKLNIKIAKKPTKYTLIVDDIFETGMTLNNFTNIKEANFFVLFSKVEPLWWHSLYYCNKNEWIVFPWENKNKALLDKEEYLRKRHIN